LLPLFKLILNICIKGLTIPPQLWRITTDQQTKYFGKIHYRIRAFHYSWKIMLVSMTCCKFIYVGPFRESVESLTLQDFAVSVTSHQASHQSGSGLVADMCCPYFYVPFLFYNFQEVIRTQPSITMSKSGFNQNKWNNTFNYNQSKYVCN